MPSSEQSALNRTGRRGPLKAPGQTAGLVGADVAACIRVPESPYIEADFMRGLGVQVFEAFPGRVQPAVEALAGLPLTVVGMADAAPARAYKV